MSDAHPEASALYHALDHVDNPTYVLSDQLRIVRVNDGWRRFALANNGASMLDRWGRGSFVLDAISGDLREFYRAMYEDARTTGERREHDYECSSVEVERRFRMLMYPTVEGFLVVTHSLRIERPHERVAMLVDETTYSRDGTIVMCASCRRVKVAQAPHERERWDWVPSFVDAMPANVSHGLCAACVELDFPSLRH
ncbi:MAG: hypothetical protein IPQ07_15030 [Myxococcales bacterium]|nr:hypothetical protein [Myxococcales bacterium]